MMSTGPDDWDKDLKPQDGHKFTANELQGVYDAERARLRMKDFDQSLADTTASVQRAQTGDNMTPQYRGGGRDSR